MCSGCYLPSLQMLDKLITALAMDRERAVQLWRAAWDGRQQRRHAEKMARHPPPKGWTALPVLPAEVQSLLRAQVQAAQKSPYRLPGARRPSLATVYVRQELGSVAEEPQPEQPRPEPVQDGREPLHLPATPPMRLTVRPPSRTVREALDGADHLVVTGGPGQGKSALSLRLAADIAAKWAAPTGNSTAPLAEPVVPLRLTARELAARLDLPLPQALADSVRREYGALLRCDVGAHLLADRVAGCRWLLLVDGLDEVADSAERDRLVTVLSAWASDPAGSPYRVMLTTRPIEGAALAPLQRAQAARYELQPFDEEALRRFAGNWFAKEGAGTAHRFVRQIREAHLDELVRVPLLATIAAIIFEQHDDRPLPDNQYELYEAYLEYLRSGRTVAPGPFEHLRTGLLEHLGRVRLEADTSLVVAARGWVAERMAPEDHPPGWQDELSAFLAAVGPLVNRRSRVEAATALATRLRRTHTDEASAVLRAVVEDAAVPVADRLTAAEGLAQCGSGEREAADRGLRALLADPSAKAVRRRGAAVVLAGLGPQARTYAVQALSALLDDPQTPTDDLVESAAGLAEIGAEFHERSAAVFRAVLRDRARPMAGHREAAVGLAALGPHQLAEAVTALTALVTNRCLDHLDRFLAVWALAEMGPQYRAVAGGHLLDRLAEPAVEPHERQNYVSALVWLGAEFYPQAAAYLRGIIADGDEHATWSAGPGPLRALRDDERARPVPRWGAATLLLGYTIEDRAASARVLHLIATDATARPALRCRVAQDLAELGVPGRDRAADALRSITADDTLPVTARAHDDPLLVWRRIGDHGIYQRP
ncbi:MAG: NACHT domain-containing protein [Pseudonocardiaceae bacterium]